MYAELTRKKCRLCKKTKKLTEFYKNGARRKDGSSKERTECKTCMNKIHQDYVEKHRERIQARRREVYQKNIYGFRTRVSNNGVRTRYHLTDEQYQDLLKKQKHVCAICKKKRKSMERRFDVDHCHKTKKIRGLLCVRCNRGIGLLRDCEIVLKNAIAYLRKSKK